MDAIGDAERRREPRPQHRPRIRRLRQLEILNVPPLVALRRLAAAAARALRVPERQPHLECEIPAQSPIWSSPRPKWLNRKLRVRSRCSAGHDGAASGGASKSFSIHAEYKFSVARFHVLRKGQRLPSVARGRGGSTA